MQRNARVSSTFRFSGVALLVWIVVVSGGLTGVAARTEADDEDTGSTVVAVNEVSGQGMEVISPDDGTNCYMTSIVSDFDIARTVAHVSWCGAAETVVLPAITVVVVNQPGPRTGPVWCAQGVNADATSFTCFWSMFLVTSTGDEVVETRYLRLEADGSWRFVDGGIEEPVFPTGSPQCPRF